MEERVRDLVQRQVEAAARDQLEQAERAVGAVRDKAAASGFGGRTLVSIAEIAASTADLRVQHAWVMLRTVLIASGVRPNSALAQEMKDFVQAVVANVLDDLRALAVQHAGGYPELHKRLADRVTEAYERALRRVDTDADLFVMALETAERQQGAPVQQIVFNGGNFGAVQLGAHSIANVTSTLDEAARQQLVRFVEAAQAHIATYEEGQVDRDELLSMLVDARNEVGKEKPAKGKLKALLGYVSNTVGVIASLQPAAEAISSALEYLN